MIVRRALEVSVGLDAPPGELLDLLTRLVARLPAADPARIDLQYALEPAGDGYVIRHEGATAGGFTLDEVFLGITHELGRRWVVRDDFALVHAGVVERDGRALVLPGFSASGKSTLVAALVKSGFRFYSDEFAPIREGKTVLPYPLPLRIRESALHRLPELGPEIEVMPTPIWAKEEWTYHAVVAADRVAPQATLPIEAVVFPRRGSTSEVRIEPISSGQGAIRLMAQTLNAEALGTAMVALTTEVAESAACYECVLGDPIEAARRITELAGAA